MTVNLAVRIILVPFSHLKAKLRWEWQKCQGMEKAGNKFSIPTNARNKSILCWTFSIIQRLSPRTLPQFLLVCVCTFPTLSHFQSPTNGCLRNASEFRKILCTFLIFFPFFAITSSPVCFVAISRGREEALAAWNSIKRHASIQAEIRRAVWNREAVGNEEDPRDSRPPPKASCLPHPPPVCCPFHSVGHTNSFRIKTMAMLCVCLNIFTHFQAHHLHN